MTLSEYQIAAFRTCPDLGELYQTVFLKSQQVDLYNNLSMKLNLSHMVEGMNSELSELDDATDSINEEEELADIMWYVGGYCTWRSLELQLVLAYTPKITRSLAWYIQELTDLVKKSVAYNKEIDSIKETAYLCGIVQWIQNRLGEQRFNVALKNNIDKLRIRYPEKFSDEAALNRNLDAERKELEK